MEAIGERRTLAWAGLAGGALFAALALLVRSFAPIESETGLAGG